MKILKAFAQIGATVDNALGVIAPVGELSPLSRTFVREKTEHVHSEFPNETLISFSYRVDESAEQLNDEVAYQVLKAINWTYSKAKLGVFTEQKDSFQQAFIEAFGDTYDLIDSGRMIQFGNYYAPEYMEFSPFQQSGNTRWKVWFADDSFANQFDEFKILVITPLKPVDQFYDDYDTVKPLVDGISQTSIFDRIRAARSVYPETVMRSDVFTWQDRNDKTLTIDTDWVTIIYGAAGDNLDSVKEAIRDEILSDTTHTRDEWAEVFPDLFTSTEFIITPMWTDFAVPNKVRETGIYSGVVSVVKALLLSKATAKGVKYTDAHVERVLCIVPSQFRSLMLSVVGGPENRDGIDLFNERYPDYANFYTTHVDFGRMSEETRQFIMLLSEMLMHAEELTPNTGVPQGFNRTTRDGVVYLSKTFNKFLYLVATRYSVEAIDPVVEG